MATSQIMTQDSTLTTSDDHASPQHWCQMRGALRRFSSDISTEDLFRIRSGESALFVGAYGQIRKKYIDHVSYHSHYQKERQWLHDSIIEDHIEDDECSILSHDDDGSQWLIFTVGVQGAGKKYSIDYLMEEHTLVLPNFCSIDCDDIRQFLPEFEIYFKHGSEVVDTLTQKETGYIAETMCWAALQAGKTVIWDMALRHPQWVSSHIQKVKSIFPNVRVAVIHITPPSPEIAIIRREKIAKLTGRRLSDDAADIRAEMDRIARAYESIRPETDISATICNTLEGLEIIDGDWDSFMFSFAEVPKHMPRLVSDQSFVSVGEDFDQIGNIPPLPKYTRSRSSLLVRRESSNGSLSISTSGFNRRGSLLRRRFSVAVSTEDNYGTNNDKFLGRYAHIRSTLDYSYHKNYTCERQRFQDSILQEYLQGAVIRDAETGIACSTPEEPWIVFTAGPMGAGKSHTMQYLVQEGRFPLSAFVRVDPDEIRSHFPEYQLYVKHIPDRAGELTRKEAGYLCEILTLAALQAGKNVLLDGSLRDADWYKGYFKRLREEFPLLRLAILEVTAPKEAVLARAKARALKTGRVIPEPFLLEVYEQVPRSVRMLAPLVDYHVTILNPTDSPNMQLLTPGETWDSFQSTWVQKCAWVPGRHKAKIKSPKTSHGSLISLDDEQRSTVKS